METEMKRDIKAIILLLATQGMINLGEIQDPMSSGRKLDAEGAMVFIELLEVLEEKTRGNLTTEEEKFLSDIIGNIKQVYKKKLNTGN